MELLTGVSSDYFIVFIDGTKKQISSHYGENLIKLSGSAQKTFTLNGQLYSFSSISKLLPTSEYYNQYPEERPVAYKKYEELDEKKIDLYISLKDRPLENKRKLLDKLIANTKNWRQITIQGIEFQKKHLAKLQGIYA